MESDRTDPPLTAADLDEIDAKLKPCTDPPFEVIGTRVSCGISRRGREIVVRADEHDIDDLEALAALRNHAEPLLALARRGLEAEAALEEVSAALDDEEDAHSETLDLLEAAEGRADEAIGKCEGCSKPATRADNEGVPICEACYGELVVEEYRALAKKHEATESDLAAALAECERVKARLACAHAFWFDPANIDGPRIGIESRQQRDGSTRWVVSYNGEVLTKAGWWEWEPQPSSRTDGFLERTRYDTLDAAWSAAEAQAGQAAKQGGEGRA